MLRKPRPKLTRPEPDIRCDALIAGHQQCANEATHFYILKQKAASLLKLLALQFMHYAVIRCESHSESDNDTWSKSFDEITREEYFVVKVMKS
jgi:hypothetical protein